MNLQNIAHILSLNSSDKTEITGICTDSRQIKPGNVFIALDGELFDGHDFVNEVAEKGAAAVIVKRKLANVFVPQFVVADPYMALAQIAAAYRKTMTCPVIALTGSNGKTSVKEMIAAILPAPSHATKGNLNNHIGAPLSALALTAEHRYAVFELGANHPGEIAHTVAVVQPHVALINNIAPAHVEGFGSIDGVAHAKGEIYQGLMPGGVAIVNDDDHYAHFWDDILVDKKVLRFSLEKAADVYAHNLHLDERGCGQFTMILPSGSLELHLHVPGIHNVRNALAAATACYAAGVSLEDIKQGLSQFTGVKGRMTMLHGKNHSIIIDDTYNANLRSVLAGLEVLAKRPGEKVFVFGDMGELGSWATEHHEEVGVAARRLGINQVLTCGSYSKFSSQAFGEGGQHFASQDDIVCFLLKKLGSGTTVLVKGSRSSAMEKIVQKLLN